MGESNVDARAVNMMLRASQVRQQYTARPGELLEIDLPRVPLTRSTQYLQLTPELHGDKASFAEEATTPDGEGSLLPRKIFGRAINPGRVEIILRAVDRMTGEEVEGVEPFQIEVRIERE